MILPRYNQPRESKFKEAILILRTNKGEKLIFEKSAVRSDGTVQIPMKAVEKYRITDDGKAYLRLAAIKLRERFALHGSDFLTV